MPVRRDFDRQKIVILGIHNDCKVGILVSEATIPQISHACDRVIFSVSIVTFPGDRISKENSNSLVKIDAGRVMKRIARGSKSRLVRVRPTFDFVLFHRYYS
jgi:hypothetical protein